MPDAKERVVTKVNPDVAASPQNVEGDPVATRGSQQYPPDVVKAGRYLHRSKRDDTFRRKTAGLGSPAGSQGSANKLTPKWQTEPAGVGQAHSSD